MEKLIYLLVLWNFTVMIIYGADKFLAIRGLRRISEKTLISLAFFMGGVGASFGMTLFRHKTRHKNFKILVSVSVIFNIITLKYITNIL